MLARLGESSFYRPIS